MSKYAWEQHDELIYGCGVSARWLKTKIEEAKAHLTHQDKVEGTSEHHDTIMRKWRTLQTWLRIVQRTESLCEWERAVYTDIRTNSPFDTAPASRSRYAWALNIRGEIPVSPMRAVSQLERILTRALQLIIDF
jgi:hypothetical protein